MTASIHHPQHLLICALAVTAGCYSGYRGNRAYDGADGDDGADRVPAGDTEGDTAGGSDGDDDDAPPPAEINCTQETSWTLDFLQDNCGGCHGAASEGKGGFDYVTDLNRLVESGKLVPGEPGASPLFSKLDSGAMPPADVVDRPSDQQIARLQDFITTCAAAPPGQCQENDPIDIYESLDLIATDLIGVDADDREFIRYLTLGHLHAAGYCDNEIDVFRAATAKMLNALSTDVKVETPLAIDDAETIYRIDLRDYGWDEPTGGFSNKWEAVANATPYAFERLEDQAEFIKQFTGSNLPILMADAVIETAMTPPLYYDLVDTPNSFAELQARLNIDVADNVSDGDVARAGIQESGVSRQNRVLERHELSNGFGQVMWVAYDFEDDASQDQNIFTSPLDFDPSLLEVIYSLPNGSHGYAMFDGNGSRLNVGLDEISSDPLQDDGDMRAGISCIGCHTSVLEAEDVIREHVLGGLDFDAQTKDDIASIYLPIYEFVELQDQDTTAYHNSLGQAGVDTGSSIEPVSEAFTQFSYNVDLKRAAAELGISDTTLLTNLGRLSPVLTPLATGTVKRSTWSALYQETVCLLNLGDTDDPACDGNNNNDGDPTGGDPGEEEVDVYGDCANNAATICGPDAFCADAGGFAVCSPVPCEVDADCPDAPADGDAPAVCREILGNFFDSCALDCSAGQNCPGGMFCAGGQICVFDRQ